MAERYGEEVVFIGVSNNDTVEDGRSYVDEFNVPYAMAHAPEVWSLFDDPYRPTTLVINRAGDVTGEIIGPITEESLSAQIEKVL